MTEGKKDAKKGPVRKTPRPVKRTDDKRTLAKLEEKEKEEDKKEEEQEEEEDEKEEEEGKKEKKEGKEKKGEEEEEDEKEEEEEEEGEEKEEYKPKPKPELTPEMKTALNMRNDMNKKRIAFHRQEWFRYKRLGDEWRKPRGLHSKMRRHWKYRPNVVSIGYRGPKAARGLHPSGFKEVLVHNPAELENIDPKTHAVRIAHTVGTKKRKAIMEKASEISKKKKVELRILNPLR